MCFNDIMQSTFQNIFHGEAAGYSDPTGTRSLGAQLSTPPLVYHGQKYHKKKEKDKRHRTQLRWQQL